MPDRTPSQTAGPFFSFGLCVLPAADLSSPDAPETITIEGRVLDGAGEGIHDALVEIWQADAGGEYRRDWGWARCGTDADGGFRFHTVKPGSVPSTQGSMQSPHLEVIVFARGLLKHTLTRMYFPDEEEANAADEVLASLDEDDRSTLISTRRNGSYVFDVQLQGERQTVFFAL